MFSSPRHLSFGIFLFVATALSFIDRQVLSVLSPTLMTAFKMTNIDYARVVFAFVLSYTVMTALGGRIMDVLGTRRGLALAVAFWSLACAMHAVVWSVTGLAVARFALGMGEGPCFPAAAKGAVEWLPEKGRAFAMAFATGGSAFGAVIAPPLTAWMTAWTGWRGTFVAVGLIGGVWVVAWLLIFREQLAAGRPSIRQSSGFGSLLRRPEVRRIAVARFVFDPAFYFFLFWIPPYLAKERGLSLAEIGALAWIPYLVLGIMTIVGGLVSDRLVRRGTAPRRARLTLMLLAALLSPVSALVVGAPSAGWAVFMICLFMTAHGFWISNFMTVIGESVASEDVATTVGISGTAGGIAGMLTSLGIGWVVDHFSYSPVFLAVAFIYPVAWVILAVGRVHKARPSTAPSAEAILSHETPVL